MTEDSNPKAGEHRNSPPSQARKGTRSDWSQWSDEVIGQLDREEHETLKGQVGALWDQIDVASEEFDTLRLRLDAIETAVESKLHGAENAGVVSAAPLTETVNRRHIVIALIIGGAIVLAACIWTYFSPYQSCVRAMEGNGTQSISAALACAKLTSGR